MPRPARISRLEPSTKINGQSWTPTLLVSGPVSAALKASTISVKKSHLSDFVAHLQAGNHPFHNAKLPCRYLFDWFISSLEDRPLGKGAARGKLYTILQAMIVHNLAAPDPLFSPTVAIMSKLAIAAAKSSPADKANILTMRNPLDELPIRLRPLALIWITTGVRWAGLFNIPRTVQKDPAEPVPCKCITIISKTATKSYPRLFCFCGFPAFAPYCPVCRGQTRNENFSMHDDAIEIMMRLQASKHSFRRSLIMGITKWSLYLEDTPISDFFRAAVLQIFGWSASECGSDMIDHYTADKALHQKADTPILIRAVVAFYDELLPIILGKPMHASHVIRYRRWMRSITPNAIKARRLFLAKVSEDVRKIRIRTTRRNSNAKSSIFSIDNSLA